MVKWCWKLIKKKPCPFYFFTILFYIFYISWLLVGWWRWAAGALEALQVPTRDPESLPPGEKNKVDQKYVLCNLIDWFHFNLLFDWRSRSKVETYICQKVENGWIYNLGGGHLWVLVTQIQDSGQVVTNLSVFTSTFWLKVSAKPTKSWLFSEAVSLVSVEKISQGSGQSDSSMP